MKTIAIAALNALTVLSERGITVLDCLADFTSELATRLEKSL